MTFQEITEIIAAGLGSIGFSMMFQLRGKKLILIGCGGALSWFIFLFGKNRQTQKCVPNRKGAEA